MLSFVLATITVVAGSVTTVVRPIWWLVVTSGALPLSTSGPHTTPTHFSHRRWVSEFIKRLLVVASTLHLTYVCEPYTWLNKAIGAIGYIVITVKTYFSISVSIWTTFTNLKYFLWGLGQALVPCAKQTSLLLVLVSCYWTSARKLWHEYLCDKGRWVMWHLCRSYRWNWKFLVYSLPVYTVGHKNVLVNIWL